MNLYLSEITTKAKRRALQVLVHAPSAEDARAHLEAKFTGCTIHACRELDHQVKHFVVAELEDAPVTVVKGPTRARGGSGGGGDATKVDDEGRPV